MAAREPTLPEGTDSIIDTNTDIGGGTSATGASGGTGGTGTTGSGTGTTGGTGGSTVAGATMAGGSTGGSSTGTTGGSSGSGGAFQFDKDQGGSGASTSSSSSSGVSKAADSVIGQLKEQVSSLKGQAGDRARGFADDGKRQATDLLSNLAQVLQDAAASVEERLGSQYSGIGNRAADAVNSLSSRIDEKSVDDLIEDARAFVQRSPAVAIGVAALIGFAVARVARSGVAEMSSGQSDTGSTGSGSAGAA
jgi:ElaB/YqjD/DUF883 family membrane-anchored ribosome-binding protein